ncbi:MAG: sodium:alanine symporter family protein [Lachnospiraceae bacterium]|nr:sodium:alanine symporter family protein [Lachnospiraceae bacterium]
MLEMASVCLKKFDDFVWGVPLIVLILATGIFLTVRLKGMQIRRLPIALKYMVKNEEEGHGEVSSFAALCTALSATIGTGNIVGVATAIVSGGPGALFWMWIAAFFGMATKYAEGVLAIRYRTIDSDGHVLGGPFYYIENGMGKNWRWLGKIFAFFGAGVGLLGIGTFTQVNGITAAVGDFFDGEKAHVISLFGRSYSIAVVISGLILTVCVALVVLGGIKRIAKVSEVVVPFMAVFYVIACVVILVLNADRIPAAFLTILESAFGLRAAAGGALGSILLAMQKGIARGIFSNEAGLGSAPIAAAAAQTKEPVRQGLVSMTGTFIDTIVICTMTGLTIVLTDSHLAGLEGVAVTTRAFQMGLPLPAAASSFLLMLCLIFFAFTTIIGWNYYGERCLEYLSDRNRRAVMIYRVLYIAAIFIGPFMTVEAVWTIADIFNALMALPNLVAILALSSVVVKETKAYWEKGNRT